MMMMMIMMNYCAMIYNHKVMHRKQRLHTLKPVEIFPYTTEGTGNNKQEDHTGTHSSPFVTRHDLLMLDNILYIAIFNIF
jgi:hypothetical protein